MFHLPPQTHKARELMGDMASLADTLHPANAAKLPYVWQARHKALEMFEAEAAAKRVCFVIVRADTSERWLVSFGRKGGWKKEWNFGAGA